MVLKSEGEFLRNAPAVASLRTKRTEKRRNFNCGTVLRVSEGSVFSNECVGMVCERGLVSQACRRREGERDEICAVASRSSHDSSNVARQMSANALEHGLREQCVGHGRVSIAFGKRGVKTDRERVE